MRYVALTPELAAALETVGLRAGPDGYDLGAVEAVAAARGLRWSVEELGSYASMGPGNRCRYQAQVWHPTPSTGPVPDLVAYRRARTRGRTEADALARALAQWLTRYG
jgi:hypothetical protein